MIRIVTNFSRFPQKWSVHGVEGDSTYCTSLDQFLHELPDSTALLVNSDSAITYGLCARKRSLRLRTPLIVADLLLSEPLPGISNRLKTMSRRFLLKGTDHYIHYFRDLTGYYRHYALGPRNSSFVPFKHNMEAFAEPGQVGQDGGYIVCVGASYRDYDVLLEAVEHLPYPVHLPQLDESLLRRHGSRFERLLGPLPPNVQFVPDDFSQRRLAEILAGAKLVVLPILPENLKASGITIYLNAMRLGRCVIISEGPGVGDVLSGQAAIVPPGDPLALRKAIQHYWEDDISRRNLARRGLEYALSLGQEQEFYQRILHRVVEVLQQQPIPESGRCFVR